MNTDNSPSAASTEPSRREFLSSASGALTAVGAVALPVVASAADPRPAAEASARKKTLLVVEGHLDDSYIGAGGVLLQARRPGIA